MRTCNSFRCRPGHPCRRCAKREAGERVAEAVTWFERTYHCHGCGQPGAYCLCTDARPCGCAHLHTMGSGIGADAAEVFAEPVSDDQQELF